MFSIFDPVFWLYFVLFLISVFFAFYIPGDILLKKLQLPLFQRMVLGIVIGMVLWGFQGIVFGYLGLRWLSYIYLLITFIFWVKTYLRKKKFISIQHFKGWKPDFLLATLVIIGSFLQLTIIWFNGFLYPNGLYFCCGNPSDNLFHIALTNQIVNHFPPFQPGMSGVVVHNYHYWSNLVVAELIRVFGLPLISTQYQYSTVLISVFLGLSIITFGQIVKLGRTFIAWLLFFLYFGGDWIYLLLFSLGKGLNFNMSSLEDGSKFLANPPRAFSIVVFFVGISLLVLWIRRRDLHSGLLMALVLGSSIGFKVYTGIFGLIGLATLGLYFLIKRDFRMLPPLLVTLLVSLAIYLPVNNNAGGLYFTGLWIFENFIVQKELGLVHLELARRIFLEHNNWIRVWIQEFIFFALFTISIFGSKLLGLFQSKKSLSLLPRELNIFLLSGIMVSAVAGFFFQQKSGGANTFNFLVAIFMFGSIYTALACYYWIGKISNRFKWIFILLVLVLTIPRVIQEWRINSINLIKREGFVIDNAELEGLNYLREKTDKTALVLVDNRNFSMDMSSPYMSFLANRPMFFSGKGILDSHGIDTSKRLQVANTILTSNDERTVNAELSGNKIEYIYMSGHDSFPVEKSAYFIKTVFQNNKVKILKISTYTNEAN